LTDVSKLYAASIITLMMAAERISETLVNFYEITERNIQEGCHLHDLLRDNLKSH
jgi:hypothetical protein